MNLHDIWLKIKELEARQMKVRPADMSSKIIKLTEEVGEISSGYLELIGYKTNDLNKEDIKENIREEIADSMIMLMILAQDMDLNIFDFIQLLNKKMVKWETKHIAPHEAKCDTAKEEIKEEKKKDPLQNLHDLIQRRFKELEDRKKEQKQPSIFDIFNQDFDMDKFLRNITESSKEQSCLHDRCPNCSGSGISKYGGMCVHMLSCPCKKCNPFSM